MRQVAILPSGCQVLYKGNILFFDEERFFYASTLAVYIFNSKTFILEKILSLNQRAITSISLSPHDRNLLVISGLDGTLCLWKIQEEEIVCKVAMNGPIIVAWNPFSANHCGIVTTESILRFCHWDVTKATVSASVTEIFSLRSDSLKVSVARWNTHITGQMAVGCSSSIVFIFDYVKRSQISLHVKDRTSPVVDLQWDRLSSIYLLVAYQSFISLWDVESKSEIHTFEKQNVHITSIAWMDWTAGNFISTNSKNGNFKVWNASQKLPLETMTVTNEGISSLYFSMGKKRVICACTDGSVCIYNIQRKKIEYKSSAGHTETIFDCKFSPSSPNLFSTVSYDGTVKLWNTTDLSLKKTFYGTGEVIYCCDWSPRSNYIVGSNAGGMIIIWEAESGHEVNRYLHHSKASYCVAWNKSLSDNYIASTSADNTLVIMSVTNDLENPHILLGSRKKQYDIPYSIATPEIIFRVFHPGPVFGCAWSITHTPIISTCCSDGNIRIFNHLLKVPLIYILQGHTARAFSCAWSPILNGLLATASDDNCVHIWKIDLSDALTKEVVDNQPIVKNPLTRLVGHTGNVRALAWNYEHETFLMSGSWDSTIRLWDTSTGTCLYVVSDHVADVYAITSHPERPFMYLSCSRDTTVRVWELRGLFARLRINAVWDCCFDRIIVNDSSMNSPARSSQPVSILKELMSSASYKLVTDLSPNLSGYISSKLNETLSIIASTYNNQSNNNNNDNNKLSNLLFGDKSSDFTVSSRDAYDSPISIKVSQNELKQSSRKYNIPPDKLSLAIKFYKIFSFFGGTTAGCMDIWENAITILAEKQEQSTTLLNLHIGSMSPTSPNKSVTLVSNSLVSQYWLRPISTRQIIHEDELLETIRSDLRKIEASSKAISKRKTDISIKTEDKLREMALSYARIGDFAKYCMIMMDIGDWTAALAMAPSVSMEYWRGLSNNYAQHLMINSSEECIPYLLGTGKDADAVDFYLRRQDTSNAMLIAKMSEKRNDLIPDYRILRDDIQTDNQINNQDNERSLASVLSLSNIIVANNNNNYYNNKTNYDSNNIYVRERTEREVDDSRMIIRAVSASAGNMFLQSAKPLLAAAQYMAVQDVESAIIILTNNFEYDFAFALALCFDLDVKNIILDMSDMCGCLNAIPLALDMLETIEDSEVEIGLFMARYCSDATAKNIIQERNYQKTFSQWLAYAQEEEEIGSDVNAVIGYINGRNHMNAVIIGLKYLKKHIKEPFDLTSSTKKLFRILKYIKASLLESLDKELFLCYMLWYAAHDAMSLGLWETGCGMLKILMEQLGHVDTNPSINQLTENISYMPVSLRSNQLNHSNHQWGANTATIIRELQRLSEMLSLPSLQSIHSKKSDRHYGSSRHRSSELDFITGLSYQHSSTLQGSLLPAANQQLKSQQSIVTGKKIQGSAIEIGDSKKYMSVNEAICWRRTNPFSPLMNGDLLIPF
eukprot:gene4746-6657_t